MEAADEMARPVIVRGIQIEVKVVSRAAPGAIVSIRFYAKPPLTAVVDRAQKEIGRLLRERGVVKSKILVRCPMSVFQHNFPSNRDLEPELAQALRHGELVMAAFSKNTRSLLFAVVDPGEPEIDGIARLLERLHIPVFSWSESNDSIAGLTNALQRAPLNEAPLDRAAVNNSEWELAVTAQRALDLIPGRIPRLFEEVAAQDRALADELRALWNDEVSTNRSKLWFWHELALRRFIACVPDRLDASEEALRKSWRAMRADLLITTREDFDYWPLLALEFDGPHHVTDAQRVIDRRRDEILRRACIPQLRWSFELRPCEDAVVDGVMLVSTSILARAIRIVVRDAYETLEWDRDLGLRQRERRIIENAVRRRATPRSSSIDSVWTMFTPEEEAELEQIDSDRRMREAIHEEMLLMDYRKAATVECDSDLNFAGFEHCALGCRGKVVLQHDDGEQICVGPYVRLPGHGIDAAERQLALQAACEIALGTLRGA